MLQFIFAFLRLTIFVIGADCVDNMKGSLSVHFSDNAFSKPDVCANTI